MFMKKILLPLLLLCQPVAANTTNDIAYLMTTPVTLWDWGIFKMNRQLENLDEDIYTKCDTLFLKSKLQITCMGYKNFSIEEGKKLIDETVNVVRSALGYRFTDKYTSFGGMRSKENFYANYYPIQQYFVNDGYKLNDLPESLGKTLEDITIIQYMIMVETDEDYGTYFCEATLQGGKPMCNFKNSREITKDALGY
jgi:hypothetical protein